MPAPVTPLPSLLDDTMTLPQLLFGLRGRISRQTWWLWGVLAMLGASVGLFLLFGIAGVPLHVREGLPSLLVLWPSIAISVKRWHDRGKSGWWVLITLVPLIGVLWALIENGCLRGTRGDNRFGADPLARP